MKRKMNWSKARHSIDSGETQEKVNYPDPAAAPLGTDEEAGGARTPPEAIERSVNRRQDDDDDSTDENKRK